MGVNIYRYRYIYSYFYLLEEKEATKNYFIITFHEGA